MKDFTPKTDAEKKAIMAGYYNVSKVLEQGAKVAGRLEVRSVFTMSTGDAEIAASIEDQLADDGLIETGQTVEVVDYASIGWMGEAYEVEYVTVEVRG